MDQVQYQTNRRLHLKPLWIFRKHSVVLHHHDHHGSASPLMGILNHQPVVVISVSSERTPTAAESYMNRIPSREKVTSPSVDRRMARLLVLEFFTSSMNNHLPAGVK